ncbi:MAG: ABC transporter ATP-binding protein, partial [Candidatus Spyradocola sp.]
TRMPMSELEEDGSREYISRATTDTASIGMLFSSILPGIVSTIYYVVGSVINVGDYSPVLSIIMLVVVALQILLAFFGGKIVYRWNDRAQGKLAALTEMVSEVMNNIPLVKIYTAENVERRRGSRAIRDYQTTGFKAQTISNGVYYISRLVSLTGTMVVIVMGGILVNRGTLDLGEWIAYFMYYFYLCYDVENIPYMWKGLKEIQGTARRLTDIASAKQEDLSAGTHLAPAMQDIKLEHVSFSYDGAAVLKDVSLEIPAGSTVALVGKNGVGKTTLLSLLERFYAPDSGSIRYGDTQADTVCLADWRALFAYIPQDVRMMGGTIRDNLTYGMERTVSDPELLAYCAKTGLDAFIAALPEGLDTLVDDFGDNLSGGQRQKIAITRMLLDNAECLLLDEYNSSLDMESAASAKQCIEALHGTRTIIVAAHSLDTVKAADRIIVLAGGCVEAYGTHTELLENSPAYRELFSEEAAGEEAAI